MLTIGLYGVPDRLGNHTAHDHAVAFVRDGEILSSLELERVTGRKHDNRLGEYLEELITPWIEPGEPVRFVQANSFLGASVSTPKGSLVLECNSPVPVEPVLVPSSLRLAGRLADLRAEAFTVSHELAHIGSCLPFLDSLEPRTLLVHVDGGASVSACSVWWWDGSRLECIHHAWNDLKAAVNNFNDSPLAAQVLGMGLDQHLAIPGKLMGLAAYGTPAPEVRAVLEQHEYFLATRWRNADPLGTLCAALTVERPTEASRSRVGQDVAACLQGYFEESLLAFLASWRQRTGARHLAYAGGAALNVVANARIERELGFETVTIPPVPSDCGLALGAAGISEWLEGRHPRCRSPYLARHAPSSSPDCPPPDDAPGVEEVAARIAAGDVIAAIGETAEAGPRALGHRSLLARPDSVPLRRRLSEQMKQREWYRPVAPMMLPDVATAALEGFSATTRLARFMLGAWRVKPAWRPAFAGCLHADGTVRAQVVEAGTPGQSKLAALLHVLREQYAVHGVINTSLNSRGRPMLADGASASGVARQFGVDGTWRPQTKYGSTGLCAGRPDSDGHHAANDHGVPDSARSARSTVNVGAVCPNHLKRGRGH